MKLHLNCTPLQGNTFFVKHIIKNANNNPLHLTLRELRSVFVNKQFVTWMAAAVIVLTAAGPFGTLSAFNTLERLSYWLILAPTTFCIASFCSTFVVIYLSRYKISKWIRYGIAGIVTGIPVGISVWAFQFFINDSPFPDLEFLTSIIPKIIPITFAITMIYASASKSDLPKTTSIDNTMPIEFFYNRLPKKLGRDIISLNAQDHYVEVKTTLGNELVLMRLSDAISELSDLEGFQTHRSWWVAKKHIISIQSNDSKKYLKLTDQTLVPVSRSFTKNIQGFIKKHDR